ELYGYDPSLYSYAENINQLIKNWENYLQKAALKHCAIYNT
ncbi:DUF2247 family protein, partial [Acinetobacter seifertii]|nr:DUF2247 family protein [Acinetobacter seifertii]